MKSERKKIQMNAQQAATYPQTDNVKMFPSAIDKEPKDKELSWIFRRLVELGVIEMANAPTTKGWNINPTTVTTIIAMLLFFGGICVWLWNVAYQKGIGDEQNRQRDAQIEQLQKELKQTKDLQLLNDKAHPDETPKKK